MLRFIIVLTVAILIVTMTWPYLRQIVPRPPRQSAREHEFKNAPKPVSRGELIYFAVLATVVLAFTMSTLLWIFGK